MAKKIKDKKENKLTSSKDNSNKKKVVLENTEARFTHEDYEFEVKRKMFHIVLGFGVIALYYFNIFDAFRLFLLILFGLIICAAAKYYKIPGIQYMLDEFERKENLKRLPGKSVIYFLIGTWLAILLFPRDIAVASLFIFTI